MESSTVNFETLKELFKPYTKAVTLSACYNSQRAKTVKDKWSLIEEDIGASPGSKHLEQQINMLGWISRYGKLSGTNVSYKIGIKHKTGIGRLYPVNPNQGYVGITRSVRHYLAHDLYTDIDIENCHPVIMEQMFPVLTGKQSEAIRDWNINREQYFSEMKDVSQKIGGVPTDNGGKRPLTRDDCKKVAYTWMYGSNMKYCFEMFGLPPGGKIYEKCKALCDEMKLFRSRLSELFPETWSIIVPGEGKNEDASKASTMMQHLEGAVVRVIMDTATEQGIEIGDICHDGLFLRKNGKLLTEEEISILFPLAEKRVKQKTGFTIRLTVKKMEIPEFAKKLTEQNTIKEPENDLEAAELLYKLYPRWVTYDNTLHAFDDTTGMWTDDENIILSIISRYNRELGKFANMTKCTNGMFKKLKSLNVNNRFIEEMEQTSIGKILFKNGIYDFNTRTFTHEYDPNIYFHDCLKYNFPTAFSDEDMLYVKQKLFTDPLGETVGQYQLNSLARALAGYIDKHIFFCIGAKGDNGKSLLTIMLSSVLGGHFGTFAGENLNISKSTDDEAKRWRWAFLLRGKRIIMSNEVNMNANLDGVIIKKLSSGGDAIIGRGHGGNETSFAPTFTTFVFANDIPPIAPHDEAIDKRIRAIPYNISFVDREQVGLFEKRMDEGLKDKLSSDIYGLALIGLFISAYNVEKPFIPSEVSDFKKTRIGDSDENSPITLFLDQYEITGNPDDFVSSTTILEWNAKHKTGKSDKGFLILLKNRAEKMGKSISPYRTSKVRGWSGIRQISDNINDECQI